MYVYVKVGRELTDLELNFDPFCSISVQYYYISDTSNMFEKQYKLVSKAR